MDSSGEEEEERVDPWSRIQNEICNRHEAQLEALINEYEQNGDSPEVARIKAKVEKSVLRVFTMDACNEERSDIPKSDGNPPRSQRQRRI